MLFRSTFSRTLFGVSAIATKGVTSFTSSRPIPVASASGSIMSLSLSTCSFDVVQIPCLNDNYGYLLHHIESGETAAIDTPDAKPYQKELENRGWKLTHIFNTHHHHDHTGGNLALKTTDVKVFGPANENIPGRDVSLQGGDEIKFGSSTAQIIDVGGHTKGHIAYYFPHDGKIFVGDSLFALGCGRMFEGTPEQYWASLRRLRELPDNTEVYWYEIVKICVVMI
jgi:hydroxyacylglutathione hydrolase